ncbi:RepB family protein [Amycolatopsis sp. NBC_01480]|uniref:RepB family protein n=1 Tax=Amycolatopsis sp. NBC_01480 TaxID=2903562 RepID=UPI002E2C388A|nr:RepB family protein [Amycolatopsis sp. NBC_01480]
MATGRGPGRPRTNRDAEIKLPVKSELKNDLVAYCKARKIRPVDLFEQWITRELANPSQPTLAESA